MFVHVRMGVSIRNKYEEAAAGLVNNSRLIAGAEEAEGAGGCAGAVHAAANEGLHHQGAVAQED